MFSTFIFNGRLTKVSFYITIITWKETIYDMVNLVLNLVNMQIVYYGVI